MTPDERYVAAGAAMAAVAAQAEEITRLRATSVVNDLIEAHDEIAKLRRERDAAEKTCALMVRSVGGKVTIPDAFVVDDGGTLSRWHDFANDATVYEWVEGRST